MGFFFEQSAAEARAASKRSRTPQTIPIELMKEQACKACSRDAADIRKEEPQGTKRPLVYVVMGEPPFDKTRGPADSEAGHFLEKLIHKHVTKDVRFAYAVRCRTQDGKTATVREATCCSGFFEQDIIDSKPAVIIGVGNRVLQWALPDRQARAPALDDDWRGKIFPVTVQGRHFWYMQVQDINYVLQCKDRSKYECGEELALLFDLRKLEAFLEDILDDLPAGQLPEPYVVSAEEAARGVKWITGSSETDWEELCMFLDDAARVPECGLDYETTGLRPYIPVGGAPEGSGGDMRILTCAVSLGDRTLSFPVHHPLGWNGDRAMMLAVTRVLIDFIIESGIKVAHNLIFELEWTAVELGQELLQCKWADSMAAMHAMDARVGSLGLGDTTRQLFGFDIKALSNLDTSRLIQYDLVDVLKYNGMDAKWCLLSYLEARRRMKDLPVLWERVRKKSAQAAVLARSQVFGVGVDQDYAQEMENKLRDELKSATRLLNEAREVKEFVRKFNRPFNPNGGDDALLLIRDIMKRDECKVGENKYSADEKVLNAIPKEAGIAPHQILTHRAVSKLLGTYILPLTTPTAEGVKGVLYQDGHVHTNYNLMVTITDRLSSDDPNVQNYPKRKRKEVRGVLCAPRGHGWLAFDYGQIEARCIAMASEDDVLVDSMWTDFDIHGHWADRFLKGYPEIKDWIIDEFGVDGDDMKLVRKTLRQEAKNKWVFPQFFGSSPYSCARNLHMPDEVAADFAEEFWDQFRGVKKWQKRLQEKYQKKFYVETLTGHRRYGPISWNELINTPIQGTAADFVKEAMQRVAQLAWDTGNYWFHPPINVHDDLGFHVPYDELENAIDPIAYEMCDVRYNFVNVPILVEVEYSPSRWNDLKKVGDYRSDKLGIHTRS